MLIVNSTIEFKKKIGLQTIESYYLIPEFYEDERDFNSWMKEDYKYIFELELSNIEILDTPIPLTFALFKKCFNIQRKEMIYDLLPIPVCKE